jgi:hypothetical protein
MIPYIYIYIVAVVLSTHYIADFIFQTANMAENKYKWGSELCSHCVVYASITWLMWMVFIYGVLGYTTVDIITLWVFLFVSHICVDMVTSVINHALFSQKRYHDGFVCVGFDQLIHYATLFGILNLIS